MGVFKVSLPTHEGVYQPTKPPATAPRETKRTILRMMILSSGELTAQISLYPF
jgi:hypothetical protein